MRLRARWVVPIVAPPVEHGAVLVDSGGRIAAIGPDAAVPAPGGTPSHDLGEVALMPGLVNAHTHLELTCLRGAVTETPFPRWIAKVKRLGDAMTADHLRASARWGVLECFAHGITTVGDTTRTGAAARAMADLGARGVAYQEVFGPDPAQLDASLAALQQALRELDRLASDRLAIGVSPHAPYTVSEPLLAAVGSLAHIQNRLVAMHVAESPDESLFVREARGPFADHLRGRGITVAPRGRTPVTWALRGGLDQVRPLLIHAVHADRDDFQLASRCGATIAHCPWSNQMLGNGRAQLGAMRAAGVTVGLGTDSIAAGNSYDLFAEMRQAIMGSPMAPNEALRLITSDAADALGVGGAGRLEPGAWGDMLAVRLKGKALEHAHDIEGALCGAADARLVAATWVAGNCVYAMGEWPGVDARAERKACEQAAPAP